MIIYWYGVPGTALASQWSDFPWDDRGPEWIPMVDPRPDYRPERYGDWFAKEDGTWYWVHYPDPPFGVVKHEGKLKEFTYNEFYTDITGDIFPDLAPKTWVEDVIGDAIDDAKAPMETAIQDVEGDVSTLSTQVGALGTSVGNLGASVSSAASTATAASTAASNAQTVANTANTTAGNAQTAANTALTLAQQAIKKVEIVTFTLSSTASTTVNFTGFTSVKAIIPIPTWTGEQVYTPGIVSYTNSTLTVQGKRSRGTLLLSAGPFEGASGTFSVLIIGN